MDTMVVVAPKIITVMKYHEASLSVQLEALRAILHFIVPGKSHNGYGKRWHFQWIFLTFSEIPTF